MRGTVTFSLLADMPSGVQPGDKLRCETVVTVHTVSAEMVDVRSYDGEPQWMPGAYEYGVYANKATFQKESV